MRSTALKLAAATGIALATSYAASAADLPRKAPIMPAPVVAAYDWSGVYIGAHVGGAWGTAEAELPLGQFGDFLDGFGSFPISSNNLSGFLGGGQIGFNVQSGVIVWGLEAEGSWTNTSGKSPCILTLASCSTDVDWMATFTARLGFTATDRLMVYVKGGAALAHFEYNGDSPIATPFLGTSNFANGDENRWGWTVGLGAEYAFTSNWSAKIEYNYMDFGTDTVGMTFLPGQTIPVIGNAPFDLDVKNQIHTVKFGLNYKFGPWSAPISARY